MSHPDYLGHTEFVSDANGDPYQYFWYSPFGDAIVEEHANTASFSSRYLFNAKELDPETGRYYYGARYYDPGLSIWLSVDPLSHKYPHLTPYNFVANNPINLIDPDGRSAEKADGSGIGSFFRKVRNWVANWFYDPSTSTDQIMEEREFRLEEVSVTANRLEERQAGGNGVDGDSDEQLLDLPKADHPGDPIELFNPTAPGKAVGTWGQKLLQAMGIIFKWVGWGTKDEAAPEIQQSSSDSESGNTVGHVDVIKMKIYKDGSHELYVEPDSLDQITLDKSGNIINKERVAK